MVNDNKFIKQYNHTYTEILGHTIRHQNKESSTRY